MMPVDRLQAEHNVLSLNQLENLSLRFDLLTGWKPQLGIKNPFPIFFSDQFTEALRSKADFVYRGVRHRHSYDLHKAYRSAGCYSVALDSFRLFLEAEAKGLLYHKTLLPDSRPDKLEFDGHFECGNCDLVRKSETKPDHYDVYLRPDTSTRGHAQWFYFSVAAKSACRATFQVKNNCKPQAMFTKGASPYFSKDNTHWTQLPECQYFETSYAPSEDFRPLNYRRIHTLSFSYIFSAGDKVFFSYCPPYSLSKLQATIKSLRDSAGPSLHFRQEQLCLSLSGLGVPILTCTASSAVMAEAGRPAIFVIARVHPGETCGSHMMHGFLREIHSNSEAARSLRDLFCFYVVPMMNPDGVTVGNFRTDLVGDDMNRQYTKPSPKVHLAVVALRKLVQEVRSKRRVVGLIDLHGHSTRPGVFTYGPQLAQSDPLKDFSQVFPWMISQRTPMFRFDKCTYKIPKAKMSTARAYFLFKKSKLHLLRR